MAPVSGSPMEMVDQYVNNNKVMMFSKTTCPFCSKVKQLFEQEKIKYEVLEIDQIGELDSISSGVVASGWVYEDSKWSETVSNPYSSAQED